jgi:hypothetical protein
MALLDDIIEVATDDKVPIGTLLRKCLGCVLIKWSR